ncbi:MAG: glycosyltransferase family protein [Humidesulfovibrio sp.]|nr:glycosyltransferase family protein [Humidesulfovibrio sp.]
MARIAWGIMGDSRGHLTRALIMAEALSHHELLFVGGGCVDELAALGHRVLKVPMLTTYICNGRVRLAATATQCLGGILGEGLVRNRIIRELEGFGADCAVSDYEYFLPRAARAMGLPCVSFDHQHVLTHCRVENPPGFVLPGLTMRTVVRRLFSVPERFFVLSFFPAAPLSPSIHLLPPVLRPDVIPLTAYAGGHILAYYRAGMPKGLLEALASTGREVRLYGQGELPPAGRVRYRASDRRAFLDDLAGCAFVAATGGHNLICEALHLGKPVMATPMFFEQDVNAWNLKRMGLGDSIHGWSSAGALVCAFEERREQFAAAAARLDVNGNAQVTAALEAFIAGRERPVPA